MWFSSISFLPLSYQENSFSYNFARGVIGDLTCSLWTFSALKKDKRDNFSPEYFSVIKLKVKIKQSKTHLPSHYWGFICIDFSAVIISCFSLSSSLETLRSHLEKGHKRWIVTMTPMYRSIGKYVIWYLHLDKKKEHKPNFHLLLS